MNKIEEIKLRKDGLDVLNDIHRYAAQGEHRITSEDEALFKWYGVYTQRPAEDGYYYWRIVSYSGSGSYTFQLSRPT